MPSICAIVVLAAKYVAELVRLWGERHILTRFDVQPSSLVKVLLSDLCGSQVEELFEREADVGQSLAVTFEAGDHQGAL